MKKRIVLVMLLLATMLFSAQLFAKGEQEEVPAVAAKKDVTEIVYWQYYYETKKDTMDTLISMFEKANPDIKVIQQTFPYEQYNTKVASSVPSGEGPNIVNLYYGWLPLYIDSGYLQPLTSSLFSNASIESEFFPLVSAAKFKGEYYALPTAVRSLALFWNKDLFKAAGLDPEVPPTTVAELVADAKKLTKVDKQGNYLQTGMTMELRAQLHHWLREVLIRQYGGTPYSEDGKTVTYNNEAGYSAFKFFTDLNTVQHIGMPNFMTDDVTAFSAGMMGMTIDGSFRLGTFDKLATLHYGVTELPSLNGVKSNFASFWANGITSFTKGKELEASLKFIDFLTSDEVMAMWLKNIGELPAKKSIATKDEFKNDPKYGPFIRGLEYATATKFVNEDAQRKVWIDAYDQVLLNGMSVQQAVDEAAKTEQAVLDKYYANK
ncbi:extracellular solute-binding protein [uncultured Sphaerochaeta sp.]|uniref:extracellular solute-binding protein n=1 Tax=uncultured Sphaerochaeta sp. TaxID=886478 RepID=UPI002A0A9EF2|nr:extracellular solute-binding protein [uncultured Sphaerochaeta sp.]